MALLGLNCAITRRIGELPLQEQDLVDDLYASLTGKLPAYALWTAILEHLQISDYDPQLHPEQVDAVVALLLRLGQKHASGEDALLYLGLETPALA